MASRISACCDWFLSYNSVRLVVMRNPKLGAVNRFIQLLVVLYSLFVLLSERQYMVKETPLGAQDIYGEVEKHGCVAPQMYTMVVRGHVMWCQAQCSLTELDHAARCTLHTHTPLGQHSLTSLPSYCNNPEFDYCEWRVWSAHPAATAPCS